MRTQTKQREEQPEEGERVKQKKYKEFAALKKKMCQKNITGVKVAKKLGLSVPTTNRKLNGYKDFKVSEFVTIMKMLQVPPTEWFLYMEG